MEIYSHIKTSCTGKRKKKIGGVPSGFICCKSLDFPWSFPALLHQELALPLSYQLVFWGRGCCADSQVCAPGGAPSSHPCQVQGSVGAVYPVRPLFPGGPALSQAQGDTRRDNNSGSGQLPSPGVSSPSNHHSLPVLTGLAGASWLSCALSTSACPGGGGGVGGGAQDPGLCPPALWAPGPALLESPSPEPPPRSRHLSCSRPFTGSACGVRGALPGAPLLC